MSFFLIVTLFLVVAFMALIFLRRKKKSASRSGRYRSPLSGGLMLERPKRRGRKIWAGFSLQRGHVFLGLVLLVMFGWLGAGYFLSETESGVLAVSESRANAAVPEQYASLGGRIFTDAVGVASSDALMAGGAAAAAVAAPVDAAVQTAFKPAAESVAQRSAIQLAANSALPTISRLDQVGLMPARGAGKVAPPKKEPAKTQMPAQVKSPAPAPQAAVSPVAAPAAPVKKASAEAAVKSQAAAGSVAPKSPAAGAAQPKPQLATAKPAVKKGLLSSSRQYTVHLGSFGEKSNAENYLAQLVSAGEKAFISESTVDGRLWHRVMSGRFTNRDEAENYGRNLKKRGLTIETGRYLVKSID